MFRSFSKKSRFKELTYGIYSELFNLARIRLGNDQDAEDVVQEAYAKAFRAFDTLKDSNCIRPWLVQILLNTIKDHVRYVAKEPAMISLDDLPTDESTAIEQLSDPEHALTESELSPHLLEALHSLPEIFVSPLLLKQLYGASYQEIATILKIPMGTVMSRIARARVLLRKRLMPPPALGKPQKQIADNLRGDRHDM